MNISLPESLKKFVDRRIAEGAYGTSSEYLRELIRRDKARVELRRLIEEGLESPVVGPADKAYWATLRAGLARKR